MSSSHQQVSYELKTGCLWVRMSNGRYWRLRQNGATKLWKRDIFRYRIPVKAGLKTCSEITNETVIYPADFAARGALFVCSETDPNVT